MPGWEVLGSIHAPRGLLHPLTPNGCYRPCRLWQQLVEGKAMQNMPRGNCQASRITFFGVVLEVTLRQNEFSARVCGAGTAGTSPPLHPLPWGCPGAHWPGRGFPGSRTPRTPRPSRREKQSTIRDVAVPLCSRRGWELILPLTGEMERLRLTKQLHNNSRGTMIEIKSSLKLLSNPTHE